MTYEFEQPPPWERLRRLSEMSMLERRVSATKWANELVSHHGVDAMPRDFQLAHRDTIAAVILALADQQSPPWTEQEEEDVSASRSEEAVGWHEDIAPSTSSSKAAPAHVIRTWAQKNGIPVSERGRIPMWVINRYHKERSARSTVEEHMKAAVHDGQLPLVEVGGTDLNDAANDLPPQDTTSSKVSDFLQILRGESHPG